jgi:hypothetical protein
MRRGDEMRGRMEDGDGGERTRWMMEWEMG